MNRGNIKVFERMNVMAISDFFVNFTKIQNYFITGKILNRTPENKPPEYANRTPQYNDSRDAINRVHRASPTEINRQPKFIANK